MGEVVGVDTDDQRVVLADGVRLQYDYLVIATGATHSYFGHDEWSKHAPGLKTVDDATEIRRRFLLAFESAEREADREARRHLLTFVIVGAGPTGVELAGAMAEIARQVMPNDFRSIDTTATRIVLLEGVDRVLPAYPHDLSDKAQLQLEKLGVEVRTNARVTEIREDSVMIGEERIGTQNVFWAAGVAASQLGRELGGQTDDAGRVGVKPDCSVPDQGNVFVVGDLARLSQGDGSSVPGVAQGAIQMGKHAARMIRGDLVGQPRIDFRYRDKGDLATIGRAAAVARIGRIRFSGWVAWLVWVSVHIFYLIGFRNRLIVMLQWTWAYLTYQRGIRLITGDRQVELSSDRRILETRPPPNASDLTDPPRKHSAGPSSGRR